MSQLMDKFYIDRESDLRFGWADSPLVDSSQVFRCRREARRRDMCRNLRWSPCWIASAEGVAYAPYGQKKWLGEIKNAREKTEK